MFPRRLLKYRLRGGVLQPFFLDAGEPDHLGMAERVIRFYEENLGRERGMIPFEELLYEVGDDRLARGLTHAMDHHYQFTPRRVGRGVRCRPLELRLKLFKALGSAGPGFSEDRLGTLRAFIESHRVELGDLSIEEVDEYLWSDDPRGFTLSRRGMRPSPEQVIGCYNLEVLDTVLSNSRMITFSTRGSRVMPRGTFVKRLVRMVKELGLIYEGSLDGDLVRVGVYGPIELFGRPTRFSWRLMRLFNNALPILRDSSRWAVEITLHLRGRDVTCLLSSESLPEISGEIGPPETPKPIFDSRVEERFYNIMKSVTSYRIEREADPIMVGDTLIVPDYAFERPDGVRYYLEIIGYWRPEYTLKKRAKLQELRRAGLKNLILLVDQDYIEYFEDIGFPTFKYKMRGNRLEAPYGRIVKLVTS
jgi:predicted nuclease of restriction endonuclease-like RecB superfamily